MKTTLSWNEWVNRIFSSRRFSTKLLLKIPVFELNNRFVFHQTWAIDIQSMHEFLQLIRYFLPYGNTVKSSVYIFPVISVRKVRSWPSVSILLLRIGERVRFPCYLGPCEHNVEHRNPIFCSINWNWKSI